MDKCSGQVEWPSGVAKCSGQVEWPSVMVKWSGQVQVFTLRFVYMLTYIQMFIRN